MAEVKEKSFGKLTKRNLFFVISFVFWVFIFSPYWSYSLSYDWAKEEYGEVGDWGDSWADSSEIDFGIFNATDSLYHTVQLNVTWFSEKPYKLKILWSNWYGNESSWEIPATLFFVALRNRTESYIQLSTKWTIIHDSIRHDAEHLTLYFRWDRPDVAPHDKYNGTFNWSVEPSKTADQYAREQVCSFQKIGITYMAIAAIPAWIYSLYTVIKSFVTKQEELT